MAGLKPMFIDCRDDLLMDTSKIPLSLVDAIMLVHIYGRIVPSGKGFPNHIVIEDLAEAHGVLPHFSTDAACWSFYKNKVVHGEEGGMVGFKNPAHAHKARQLRSLGFTEAHDFTHVPRGVNARMSNLHAAPILDSFRQMKQNLRVRQIVAERYDALTKPEWRMPRREIDWVYDVRIPGMTSGKQDALVSGLRKQGVEARHCFKPCSSQWEYSRTAGGCNPQSNAARLSQEVIYLPVNEFMTSNDVVANVIKFETLCKELGL
jgi:perosamine synthetase